jgi:hypothetical protein
VIFTAIETSSEKSFPAMARMPKIVLVVESPQASGRSSASPIMRATMARGRLLGSRADWSRSVKLPIRCVFPMSNILTGIFAPAKKICPLAYRRQFGSRSAAHP